MTAPSPTPKGPDMTDTIRLTVSIDPGELLLWAGKHADAGHAGVAHVLFQAATDVESLSAQAIREAKAEAFDLAVRECVELGRVPSYIAESFEAHNPYRAAATQDEAPL